MSAFANLPTRRDERWKYSDLKSAVVGIEETPDGGTFLLTYESEPDQSVLVLPPRTTVGKLVLGMATSSVGRYVVAAGESRRIEFTFEAIAGAGGKAVEIEVGANASVQLVESWYGESGSLGAATLSLRIGEGASVQRTVTQVDAPAAVLLSETAIQLAAGATFRQFIYAEGARLARMETVVSVEGEGALVELNGVYLADAGRHADLTSVVEHRVRNGVTRQLIKGAARAGGRGVFQGKILVAPHAQNTDARQNHHALLLEDGAEVFAKPELEIHADDVQCAHGNTVGGLDANALFYMRSRGIAEGEARALLVEAFLIEAVPEDLPAELHEEILTRIRAWLGSAP